MNKCSLVPSCPAAQTYDVIDKICKPTINPQKNKGPCPTCPPPLGANPIHLGTGNKFQTETDYTGAGPFPLVVQRYYNSISPSNGNLGSYWRSEYARRLVVTATTVTAQRQEGKEYVFTLSSGQWVAPADVQDRLFELKNAQGIRTGWNYVLGNNQVENYEPVNGYLSSITNSDGLVQSLTWNLTTAQGGDGNSNTLDRVTDPSGRTLSFTYDASGRVSTMTDTAGGIYTYTYDANNNLMAVVYPDTTPATNTDNPKRQYLYENHQFLNALTGILDENGNRSATWTYDSWGRAISSEHAGGADKYTVTYNANGTTTLTNSLGQAQIYTFTVLHLVIKPTHITGGPCPTCANVQSVTYAANGFVSSRTDYNGNVTTYVHNALGQETLRTEASGTPQARTITTDWHATFRLPIKITEPGKVTLFTYDAQGRLIQREEQPQ